MDNTSGAAHLALLHAEPEQLFRDLLSAHAHKFIFPDGEFATIAEFRAVKRFRVLRHLSLPANRAGQSKIMRLGSGFAAPLFFFKRNVRRFSGRMFYKKTRQSGNALTEAFLGILSFRYLRQLPFPAARRLRRGNLWRNGFNQPYALIRRNQILA